MPSHSWQHYEERRAALERPLSRAELARRAGVSESTVAKGLRFERTPRKKTRERLELVLEMARRVPEAGL